MKRILFTLSIVLLTGLCINEIQADYVQQSFAASYNTIRKDKGRWFITTTIDLHGQTMTLPNNCTLVFDGGTIENGTVVGNNSDCQAQKKCIFRNIKLQGTWHVSQIPSEWFDFGNDARKNLQNFRNLCTLTDDSHPGTITIKKGKYKVAIEKNDASALPLNSRTTLVIDGTLLLQPNSFTNYAIVRADQKQDIVIRGAGKIVGDVDKHIGNKGEWGMGVSLLSCQRAVVQNLTIRNCWGDCLYIGQHRRTADDYCEDVVIDGVTCDGGRRQGLSLIAGKNVVIRNSTFKNTGAVRFTWPGAGIDIEPNSPETVVDNVVIDRCTFKNNNLQFHGDLLFTNLPRKANVVVKQCSGLKKVSVRDNAYGVHIQDCDIDTLLVANLKSDANFSAERCRTKIITHQQH
ncbi:MAG: right-handed parallel beta-helix repeat-containing protein [Bacteroidaceae bacterium]|nr:right-handed parallel beta-helix repeat-containing protein [Bacteroidaceae bacterium]